MSPQTIGSACRRWPRTLIRNDDFGREEGDRCSSAPRSFPGITGEGTAGNPKGRPRGSKNLTYLVKAARDQIFATARGRSRMISELQATAMSSLWL